MRAQAAVDAVRSGAMSYRVASESYSVSVGSIAKRLKGEVRMDASVGSGTVLSLEEENSLEDALIWVAHRHLGLKEERATARAANRAAKNAAAAARASKRMAGGRGRGHGRGGSGLGGRGGGRGSGSGPAAKPSSTG